jgi:hypothetical protein
MVGHVNALAIERFGSVTDVEPGAATSRLPGRHAKNSEIVAEICQASEPRGLSSTTA